MNDGQPQVHLRINVRAMALAQYLIVSVMMACAGITLVEVGERLLAEWQGDFVVFLCFLVTLEAMYSRRISRQFSFPTGEWILFHLGEVLLLMIVIKATLYQVRGWGQLQTDLQSMNGDFLYTLFGGEFMFVGVILAVVWFAGRAFSDELALLEVDERTIKLDEEGGFLTSRQDVRKHLANIIMIVGGAMIVLTTLVRVDWQRVSVTAAGASRGLINLILYFLLALVLLSLTQLGLLRMRWVIDDIPVREDLTARWLAFSALFLGMVAVIARILPTRYSIGILSLLGIAFDLFTGLIGLLAFLLITPFMILFNLLLRLLGIKEVTRLNPPDQFQLPPANAQPVLSLSWWDVLRSILFWAVFIAVVGYAILFFLRQHDEFYTKIRQIKGFLWLSAAWKWMTRLFGGIQHQIVSTIETALVRLRNAEKKPVDLKQWKFVNLKKLSPRERVLFYYLALIRRAGEKGLPRHPSETPREYTKSLQARISPDETTSTILLNSITDEFIEARYSNHPIPPEKATLVQAYWQRLQKTLIKLLKS